MDKYDKAVAIWIGRRTGDDPELISNIKFDTIEEGFCETCQHTSMGITYSVGKSRRSKDHTMQYNSPAKFIREVSAIIQEEDLSD